MEEFEIVVQPPSVRSLLNPRLAPAVTVVTRARPPAKLPSLVPSVSPPPSPVVLPLESVLDVPVPSSGSLVRPPPEVTPPAPRTPAEVPQPPSAGTPLPAIKPLVTEEQKREAQRQIVSRELWERMNKYEKRLMHRLLEIADTEQGSQDLRWMTRHLSLKYVQEAKRSKSNIAFWLAVFSGHLPLLGHSDIDLFSALPPPDPRYKTLNPVVAETSKHEKAIFVLFTRYSSNFLKRMGIDQEYVQEVKTNPRTSALGEKFRVTSKDVVYQFQKQTVFGKQTEQIEFGQTGNLALMLELLDPPALSPSSPTFPVSVVYERKEKKTKYNPNPRVLETRVASGLIDRSVPRKILDLQDNVYKSVTEFVSTVNPNTRDPEADIQIDLPGYPDVKTIRDLRSLYEQEIYRVVQARVDRALTGFLVAVNALYDRLAQGEQPESLPPPTEPPSPAGEREESEEATPPEESVNVLDLTPEELLALPPAMSFNERECFTFSVPELYQEDVPDTVLTADDVVDLGLVSHPAFGYKVRDTTTNVDLSDQAALLATFYSDVGRMYYRLEADTLWKEEDSRAAAGITEELAESLVEELEREMLP